MGPGQGTCRPQALYTRNRYRCVLLRSAKPVATRFQREYQSIAEAVSSQGNGPVRTFTGPSQQDRSPVKRNGPERHCNLKHQLKNLIYVLQRPVELTTQSGHIEIHSHRYGISAKRKTFRIIQSNLLCAVTSPYRAFLGIEALQSAYFTTPSC